MLHFVRQEDTRTVVKCILAWLLVYDRPPKISNHSTVIALCAVQQLQRGCATLPNHIPCGG